MLESNISKNITKELRKNGFLVNALPKPSGWPDLQAFKNGHVTLIEVKQPGKGLTELQKVVVGKFNKNGFIVHVARSVHDLYKLGIL